MKVDMYVLNRKILNDIKEDLNDFISRVKNESNKLIKDRKEVLNISFPTDDLAIIVFKEVENG